MGQEFERGNRRGRTAGFTFVEILAALVFLAVVIPAIVTALTLSNKASELTERGGAAGQLAENKLNEMLVNDAWQTGSATSGDCGPDWPGYRWEMTQSPWTGGAGTGSLASGSSSGNVSGGSGSVSGSSSSSGSSGINSGTLGNASLTELKVQVFFKVQGNERNVTLSTLVNSLTSSSTTTTSTSTGGTTP